MVELEFDYEQSKVFLQANLTDYFSNVITKYYQKTLIEPNSVIFVAHSFKVQENNRIMDIMDQSDKKNNKLYIAVFPLYINVNKKVIEDSKEIICPKCSEQCQIKIEDYNVKLFDCKNNHSTILSLNHFKESQKIDLSQIKCNFCKNKNIGNSFDHIFFYCRNCKANVCVLCKEKHNKNHFIINYEQKDYTCPLHNDSYFKYCHDCKLNICMSCNQMHINHRLEPFENLISNPDSKRFELDKLKDEIDIFNNHVKKIINGLNQLIENMETYYKIFNNIFNNYNVSNKNYQILKNISQINLNNNIYNDLVEINQNKNYFDKINKIFNVFYKMKGRNNPDPFNFFKSNNKENNNNEPNTLFLFSNVPSYIKKETKISKDSIYRCKYCPYIPLMKIMYKGYKVYMEYRCQNGHYSYEKLYDFYQRNKNNSINNVRCCIGNEINDGKIEFYYCNDCKKYYCEKDMKAHEKNEGKPHNLINIKYIDNACNEHMTIINDYCLDCHKNICNKCKSHSNHKKISISRSIIGDNKLIEYRKKLNDLKRNYNKFYDECDKTIREVLDYIENFNENLKAFKNVNDYSFNVCEDLLNSYQYLKSKNALNYEIIANINSLLNFNDIKFTMDKNFHCIARLIYINSIIKLEYNTLFKHNNNFINFDLQITEDEEKLIKAKNSNTNLQYRKIIEKNFENTYYGFFKYDPEESESKYEINGFGIKMDKEYKYIGEFKNGKCHGYGIYYYSSGSYKFAKNNLNSTVAYKLYGLSGQTEFCFYNKIIDSYQKSGVLFAEMTNGTKEIYLIKDNNCDDYGLTYNINGELYEGYHLSGVKHGFGIFNSQAENKIRIGVFDRGDLKFGRKVHKDWIIEGEFNMGLENGYIVEYDQLKRKQFEGTFKDGKREGFGIRYYDNGNISYKGFFTNDLEDKFGFLYNSSGKVFYVGHIDKGQKRGFGIYYAYDQKGKKLYKYIGNWINDDIVDGYLLKKFADGDYFFGFTKMFVYQTFMKYKEGNKIYIGETRKSNLTREGYGETIYSNGKIEKGIYINDRSVFTACD